ncbi:MAG: hypothetical protein ABIQ44_04020 [Chloroflexia bacterium]
MSREQLETEKERILTIWGQERAAIRDDEEAGRLDAEKAREHREAIKQKWTMALSVLDYGLEKDVPD